MSSGQPSDAMSDAETGSDPTRRGLRSRTRVSIQSKLMMILLLVGISSVVVVGIVGYAVGGSGMRAGATERLIDLRESQKRAVETLFAELTNSLIIYSRGYTALEAVQTFTVGFDKLADATTNPAQQQAIVSHYDNKLIKPIQQRTGERLDIEALLPKSNAQTYLQARYTASVASRGDQNAIGDARDGGAWSAADARFNDYFSEIVTRFEYQDAVLLDTRGNVVYSVDKGVDLGTNILTGPYRESNLRDAYQKALGANVIDFVWITDYEPYQPHLNAPTAWLVSPVGTEGRIEGVLALPMPISKINRIMTADRRWDTAGMSTTTETYLAGSDHLMRSDSRVFLEDPKKYEREAVSAGTPPDVVTKAIQLGGTTLVQPVADAGLRAAQRGQSGMSTGTSYLGNRELQAYAPLTVPHSDLHWSVLATRDESEAFTRMASFTKAIVLTIAAIVFVICMTAMLLAQIFVRPIRRLKDGAQWINSGDYNVTIPVTSRDEIADLTDAFNEMSRSLEIKEEQLNEQRKNNDRLLLSLMPEPVARRYRDGEQAIAQEHQDVTVIYADIIGLDEISTDVSGNELVGIVDDLIRQFDSAAESLGVEYIRTLHNGYLASCGLTTPRLDNVHRTVEFALELQRILDRSNGQTGRKLHLRECIHTGNVVSGLVGRSQVIYDMWGATMNAIYQMHSSAPQSGIYVSSQVCEVMGDMWQFTPAGTLSIGGSEQLIWRLSERQ